MAELSDEQFMPPKRGHDGMTWQERRDFKKRFDRVQALFFTHCDVHGRHVPIHPFREICFYCAENITPEQLAAWRAEDD